MTGPTPWRLEFGILWVRTECTEHELTMRHADLVGMTVLAGSLSAAVLSATGWPVLVQPNGWAAVPPGADPRDVCNAIDRALAELLASAEAAA